MKSIFCLAILVFAFFGNSFAAESKIEAIKFLVADLSKNSLWTEGPFKITKSKKLKILQSRVDPNECRMYKIVRISSDQGGKFLIFRYDLDHWWSKSYDTKEQYLKAEAEQDAAANP